MPDSKIRVAVAGYGNIGKYSVEAIREAGDMELAGVVRRSVDRPQPPELADTSVVNDIGKLDKVDAVVLALPSRRVPEAAAEYLRRGISTVDSFDIHGDAVYEFRRDIDLVAKQNGRVALVAAGWDPGTDSLVRAMFEFMAPRGITYTNFGPGMSMGHSVAVRAIPGVADAISLTLPAGFGTHKRQVYVRLKPGADFDAVREQILNDPYFVHDETSVVAVEDVNRHVDRGHGVSLQRYGGGGSTENQTLTLSMRINNPALTAAILVAAARAATKQKPGAYTILEIPVIDFLPGERLELVKRLV